MPSLDSREFSRTGFGVFWTGQGMSQLAYQFSKFLFPVVAVLMLDATEAQVGYLNAAGLAAFLIVGLPAGAFVDRRRKNTIMVAANFARASSLLLVPLLWATGNLSFPVLCGVVAIHGTATVLFDVASQSVLPSLVGRKEIPAANGRLETTQQLAALTGPALAGWAVGALAGPVVLAFSSVTYLISGITLIGSRRSEDRTPGVSDPRSVRSLLSDIAAGLHFVTSSRSIRRIVLASVMINLGNALVNTLIPIHLLRNLGMPEHLLGLMFGLGSLGGLAGAAATSRLSRAIGPSRLIPMSASGVALSLIVTPFAIARPDVLGVLIWMTIQSFLMSFFGVIFNITQVAYRQQVTPSPMLGRMNASVRFMVWGVMPLGALAAGWLGTSLGVAPTIWVGAIVGLLSVLPVALRTAWLTPLDDRH